MRTVYCRMHVELNRLYLASSGLMHGLSVLGSGRAHVLLVMGLMLLAVNAPGELVIQRIYTGQSTDELSCLTEGPDHNFYGTAELGGTGYGGYLFRLSHGVFLPSSFSGAFPQWEV